MTFKIKHIFNSFLFGLILFSLVVFFSLFMISRQVESQFKNEAQIKSSIVSSLIKNSLVISDYHEIKKVSQTLIDNPDILYIEVKNNYGDIIALEKKAKIEHDSVFEVVRNIYEDLAGSPREIGRVSIKYSYSILNKIFKQYFTILVVFTLFLFSVLLFVFHHITKAIVVFFNFLSLQFVALEEGGVTATDKKNKITEFYRTSQNLYALSLRLVELKKKEQSNLKFETITKISSQVSHDIRSPLAALSVATSDLKEVPEEKRILIRSAVQRIEDIANDLASRRTEARDQRSEVGGQTEQDPEEKRSTHHLTSIIQTIISEKRTEHQQRTNVKIELQCEKCAYNYFAKIQPSEFKRILSNLINNAYEALKGEGEIVVSVIEKETGVLIAVKDNGSGITPDKLPLLAQRGATFGKEKGQGLGLFHAKETIESWGGSIAIESQEGLGTAITLSLPKEPIPDWFADRINITKDHHVVILDDDESIHLVWKGRLREHGIAEDHVHHFTKPDEMIRWFNKRAHELTSARLPADLSAVASAKVEARRAKEGAYEGKESATVYLCDFELLGSIKTGLDVIKELGIASQSILVTSHYEEKEIRGECKRLGIKLLPKSLAGFVPIKRIHVLTCSSVNDKNTNTDLPNVNTQTREHLNAVDCIFIDDEELNHTTWEMVARIKKKKIAHFNHPDEFFQVVDQYAPQTPVYIDSDLGNGVKGEIIAQEIYNKGFKEIYLCTGSEAKDYPPMPWIKKVVGKGVPFV